MADRIFAVVFSSDVNEQSTSLDIDVLKRYGDVQTFSSKDADMPKLFNKILEDEKNKASGSYKFLHIISSRVQLLKDPQQFIEELEDMMIKLDYHVWLSTVCDECNYVYKKYNPRIRVSFDDDKSRHLLKTKALSFTSNSNTTWIAYDLSAPSEKLLKFDDRFTVPMYYIIELLARRRNTKDKGSLYYMNQYATVDSELRTYKLSEDKKTSLSEEQIKKKAEEEQKIMVEENNLFQSMNIDIKPDNSVDTVLEDLYKKLKSKNV